MVIRVLSWFASSVFRCCSRFNRASVLSNRTTGSPAWTKVPSGINQATLMPPPRVLGVTTGTVSRPVISPMAGVSNLKDARSSFWVGIGSSSGAARTLVNRPHSGSRYARAAAPVATIPRRRDHPECAKFAALSGAGSNSSLRYVILIPFVFPTGFPVLVSGSPILSRGLLA